MKKLIVKMSIFVKFAEDESDKIVCLVYSIRLGMFMTTYSYIRKFQLTNVTISMCHHIYYVLL